MAGSTAYYPGNQDPHKSLQPIRSGNSRSRLPRDQRSTTESTEIHGKENPNQLPLSVSFPGATPARRVGSFRGYPFVMILLAGVILISLHVLGAGLLASQDPAQILFEQRQKVLVAQRPAGTLMRAEGFQLLVSDGAGQQ